MYIQVRSPGRAVARRLWIVVALATSCVPSRSTVFDPVDREVQRRVGLDVTWSDAEPATAAIDALLTRPLTLDAAVRIGFARNRRLQARFDELGIAASQVADATVLPHATVDGDYKRAVSGPGSEIELTVVQDVLDLLQLGQRRGIANAELRSARARAISATVELAARIEIAFYEVLATGQEHELAQTAFEAANAAADLVERQHAAGNTSDLALVREQEQRERSRIEVGRAVQAREESRATLAALLGLAPSAMWKVAGALGEVPATKPMLDDLEQAAAKANLDLDALHADADAADERHHYAIVRAFLPELGVGVAVARRDGAQWEAGPALRLGIPLFDQQQGPRARARVQEHRARNEIAATTTDLIASARTTRSRVDQAFAEAHQLTDVVIPLRRRVLEETVLQYNVMNATTFELLSARRDMVEVGRQHIQALRRYWSSMAEVTALRRGGHAMKEGTL